MEEYDLDQFQREEYERELEEFRKEESVKQFPEFNQQNSVSFKNTTHTNLNKIVDALQTHHFGDRDILEVLVLSAVSAHTDLDKKLHVSVVGTSDEGKTDAEETVFDMVSIDNKYKHNQISPKVLYYEAEDIPDQLNKNGKIIKAGKLPYSFKNKILRFDDVNESYNEILKNIANTSNTPPNFATIREGRIVSLVFDAQPVIWITKVDFMRDTDNQTDRRFFTMEMKPKLDTKIIELRKHILSNNIKPKVNQDWIEASLLLKEIMNRPGLITIPDFFISKITNSGLNFLIAMIRSLAKIEGRTIANQDDINEANRLYFEDSQVRKLKESARILLDSIPYSIPIDEEDESTTVEGFVLALRGVSKRKISIHKIRRDLKQLEELEYINSVTIRHGRKQYYRVR